MVCLEWGLQLVTELKCSLVKKDLAQDTLPIIFP
jgi:hypothetical protein